MPRSQPTTDDTPRAILALLAEGCDVRDILALHPALSPMDVQEAAALALAALDGGESRAARIARVRLTHPRAFESWTRGEDARLANAFAEGARVAHLARELGRPPGAVRMRLEKLLGPAWRAARP